MLLFGGAKAAVSYSTSDPPAIGARAPREHHGDGINEPVVSRPNLPCTTDEQLFDEQFKSRGEFIQAAVDGLIRGQGGKPLAPMILDVIIDAALSGVTSEMPEQVHG